MSDKRFLIFPVESMRSFCDQAGFANVPDTTMLLLSEDVNFRLRELVHNSVQLMKHARRRKLLCSDINDALIGSDCDQIYGHGINRTPYESVKIPGDKIFSIDEPVIDLREAANKIIESNNRIKLSTVNENSVNVKWLTASADTKSKITKTERVLNSQTTKR